MKILNDFKKAITTLFSDKVLLTLTLIPIIIGALIYAAGFYYIYDMFKGFSLDYLDNFFSTNSWFFKGILYLFQGLMSLLGYFIVNWTFVLIVSLIASPFNDFISQRVEKKLLGKDLQDLNQSFKSIWRKVFFIIFNEMKKITFIFILSIISLIFGYIPFLTPFALIISFLLIAIQFIDYSWARHDWKFSKCLNDILKNIIPYSITGAAFFFLINVPFLNLFVPAIATTYYTVHFTHRLKI